MIAAVGVDTIAQHEVGHAVMHWLRGSGVRYLTVSEDGGFSAGTNRCVRAEDALLITLAGFAAEAPLGDPRPRRLRQIDGLRQAA